MRKHHIENQKELFSEHRNKNLFFCNNVSFYGNSFVVLAYTLKLIEEYITTI